MLRIDGLTVAYGGLQALVDVSLEVAAGQFVAIVGPNGAGKTTLFKTISGTVQAGRRPDHVRRPRPPRRAAARARAPRHRARAGRAAGVPVADACSRTWRWARYPTRARRMVAQSRADLRALPGTGGARGPARGDAVRGRAADARDRPRARLLAAAADARRAVDGARANARRPHLRAASSEIHRRDRGSRCCWSSSAWPRRSSMRPRLCARIGAAGPRGHHETLLADERVKRAYLGM